MVQRFKGRFKLRKKNSTLKVEVLNLEGSEI